MCENIKDAKQSSKLVKYFEAKYRLFPTPENWELLTIAVKQSINILERPVSAQISFSFKYDDMDESEKMYVGSQHNFSETDQLH
ncbi:MAG: hypothetical protein JWQ09_1125 [Segetibacter sp.]|nr:hypothetical protein [Segetibacter sp.]